LVRVTTLDVNVNWAQSGVAVAVGVNVTEAVEVGVKVSVIVGVEVMVKVLDGVGEPI
jgi:hypothetical protein